MKILNKNTTAKSHVFITSKSEITQALFVKKIYDGEGFDVAMGEKQKADVEFDYWIVSE